MVRFARPGWGLLAAFLLRALGSAVSIDPCPATAQSFEVTTTEDARNLVTALNCSGGGSFDVLWQGTVIVDETIALTDGSVVTIAGVGSGSIVDGNGTTKLFTVANATLNLADVTLENGYGYSDGSIYGGAVWAAGGEAGVSCSGTTAFNNNTAYGGGAVAIEYGAVGLWRGDTSFTGNTAHVTGGAVYSYQAQSLSWTGQTRFTRNMAEHKGGALASTESSLTFIGETTFSENYAITLGGAILATESNASWYGNTTFENSANAAATDGAGAVQCEDSVLSWQGNTSFKGGLGGRSGALSAFRSNVSWQGEMRFCDNKAVLSGGAVSIYDSSVASWTGSTLFCNNRVINSSVSTYSGLAGALQVLDSNVSWNGTITFANNSAYVGGAVYADRVALMSWGGTSVFVDNTAIANGGAVALGTVRVFNLETNLSFSGNVADVAGGAVYMSGTTYGITWRGVTFNSNSALIGGGVYSVGGGTATEYSEEFPTKYVYCVFCNNTAAVSGGAIESAAGKDIFVNTTFEGNTAGELGGGLRLAGTATVTDCDFVGNGANQAGPAVANVGNVVVENSSFSNNKLVCAAGEFLNYNVEGSAGEAIVDHYNSVCNGCNLCSGDCPTDGSGTQECIKAIENTNSTGTDKSGASITLETLRINPGYWRSINSSTTILPCWNKDACLGGLTDAEGYCEDGYRGPYCAICADNYAPTLAYTCGECSNGEGVTFAVVVLLVMIAAVVAVISHLVSNTHNQTNTRLKQLTTVLPVQGLKIVVVAWQILTQFDSVANVTYAGVYGEFLDGISSIISFDLGMVLSAGCMATTDFHDRLLLSTLGPLVALGGIAVCFKVATRRNQGSDEGIRIVRRKHFSMALLVTFLVYSSVSSTIFRVFDCETLDGGAEYLRADYTIECTDAKHKALQAYGVFMILLYPIGIPVLYGIILFKNREVLNENRHRSEQSSEGLEVTASLWKPYKPSRYYYEVVECARRVTLTGVVVFIYPNTAAQVAVTLVLVFFFVMVSESLAPYATTEDAWLSRVGHIVVFLSMFQALVLKVDVSDEGSYSQEVFGGVLLAANICMVAAVTAEAAMVICSFCGRRDSAVE